MKLYRYSPIETEDQLTEAVEYVAKGVAKLFFRDTGELHDELISSLTIFAHYESEFKQLSETVAKLGRSFNNNNGPRVELHKPLKVSVGRLEIDGKDHSYSTTIKYLRIRKPDPYRMQVGCADLNIDFYDMHFEGSVAFPDPDTSPRLIQRKDYDMLELFNPDIDVLAYIVSPPKDSVLAL